MAKTSSIEKNNRRIRIVEKFSKKRSVLKSTVQDKSVSLEERFKAQLKLTELPRDSAKSRVRNRCEVTGRPRAYYRKLKMSRIALRDFGSLGLIPGIVKSSW